MNPIDTTEKSNLLVSDTYKHITTRNILNALEGTGFEIQEETISNVRVPHRRGYQKHLVTLRRTDWAIDSENELQILCRNSNDGGAAMVLYLGVFRYVCANGLMVGNPMFSARISHSGDIEGKISKGLEYLYAQGPKVVETVKAMREKDLSVSARSSLVNDIVSLRLSDKVVDHSPITARREEDTASDLWTTYNRAQEALIRGGFQYTSCYENVKGVPTYRVRNAQGVRSINRIVTLNTKAWNVAESYLAA